MGTTCDINPGWLRGVRFMNYSNGLDSMPDLKITLMEDFCSNCPMAVTFDGRFFRSSQFPAMVLDITTMYPDYPATGIKGKRYPRIPLRRENRHYHPDGRVVPEGASIPKTAVPALRQP